MVQALLAVRLVEIGVYERGAASMMVRAIEAWLASITEHDARDPGEAQSLRPYTRGLRDRERFAKAVEMMDQMRADGTWPPQAVDVIQS